MCCTSGVPMQVALNALIKEVRPDHILIEPTGLGHPKEILGVLRSKQFSSSLEINATITLVDARKLSDERYLNHDTFNQQLYVSDVIVANKSDAYEASDRARMTDFLAKKGWSDVKQLVFSRYGDVDIEWLSHAAVNTQTQWIFSHLTRSSILATGSEASNNAPALDVHKLDEVKESTKAVNLNQMRMFENYSQGYFAIGWDFPESDIFDLENLRGTLEELNVERVKAIINTPEGLFGLNLAEIAER